MKKTLLTLAPLVFAGSLFAQWQMVDDMESYTVDVQLEADPWNWYTVPVENFAVLPSATTVADPLDAGQGNVLAFAPGVPAASGSNATLERALSAEQQIADNFPTSNLSTFYFKVARPLVEGVPGEADITWGLVTEAARSAETMQHGYGSYSVLGRYEIDGIMDIRNGGTYTNLVETALNTQVWYEIWYVIDHSNNTFSQFIKGGTDFPIQTEIFTDAEYRNATFENLDTILIVTTAGSADAIKGKDPIYFDDFHIDIAAANLTSPDGTDNGTPATGGKFGNISTRGTVGVGDDALIGGFVIAEDDQQVLIQAIGQELVGVTGFLIDPVLSIRNSAGEEIGTNDNWDDTQGPLITDLWGGAPPFADGSLSSGGVWTLAPGSYTAIITGKDDTTGVALIEVYQID